MSLEHREMLDRWIRLPPCRDHENPVDPEARAVVRGVHLRQAVSHVYDWSRGAGVFLAGACTLSSLVLAGCGAAPKPQASAPTAYDWSDYKGTFAQADERPTVDDPVAGKTAKPKAGADPKADVADASAKKLSKGTILGESVSSVSVDTVAGASTTVLKSKVVTSNVIVGQEYEQLQVVMKGVAVQIIRPAATPDKAGPNIRSPKARSGGLLKTESGWYDADANVLVLVRAQQKAKSQKALLAILKR